MGAITINAGLGKPFFENASLFRTKADDSDRQSPPGTFVHNPIEFSGQEASEWESFFKFLAQQLQVGHVALAVYNPSGSALDIGTPVHVLRGPATAQLAFYIEPADAATGKPANAVLLDYLPATSSGVAYIGGIMAVASFNCTGATVGDPVYLNNGGGSGGGGLTLTRPSSGIIQRLGFVNDNVASGVISFSVAEPEIGGAATNISNRQMAARTTVSDGDLACSTGVTKIPHGYVAVTLWRATGTGVDGADIEVGNADKTHACYFSGDGGTTPRAHGAVQWGDYLYWNQSVAGFNLATTNRLSFNYLAGA